MPLHFREATAIEARFLSIVCRHYSEIEEQIRACLVADYDPTGWFHVRILKGPPSPIQYLAAGPMYRKSGSPGFDIYLDTIICTNASGMLEAVEILDYLGSAAESPLVLFAEADETELIYPDPEARLL